MWNEPCEHDDEASVTVARSEWRPRAPPQLASLARDPAASHALTPGRQEI